MSILKSSGTKSKLFIIFLLKKFGCACMSTNLDINITLIKTVIALVKMESKKFLSNLKPLINKF